MITTSANHHENQISAISAISAGQKNNNFVGKFNPMAEESSILKLFTTRMRQLILQYQATKKENEQLCAQVAQRDSEIKQLQEQLNQARNDYQSLQMAKMIEITDGDMEAAKKRIAGLIREVNKCITLLSDQ